MRITRLHLDGFGLFHDRTFTGLDAGFVLFCGENETGKSTLLGFIRAILFGFPRSNSKDPSYLPLNGGVHGGRMDVITREGEACSISRKPGPGGGVVTLTGGTGTLYDKAKLDSLLGGVSYEAYKNIMAFGLSELAGMETLSGEHIAGAIYGAGASMTTMPSALKSIRDRKEKIFRKKGKQPLNLLCEELDRIRKALQAGSGDVERFDALSDSLARLEGETASCLDRLNLTRREEQKFEALERVREDWLTLRESRRELSTLAPPTSPFPEDGLSSLARLLEERDRIRSALSEMTDGIKRLRGRMSGLPVNDRILGQAAPIGFLLENRAFFLENLRKFPLVVREKEETAEAVSRLLRSLGKGWDEGSVLGFDRSLFAREEIRRHQTMLEAFDRDSAALEALVAVREEALREKAAAFARAERETADKCRETKEGGALWPAGMAGIGIIAGILAAALWNYRDAVLLLVCALAAAFAIWAHGNRKKEENRYREDQLLRELTEKKSLEESARKSLEKILSDRKALSDRYREEKISWENRCLRLGFLTALSPATSLEALGMIEKAAETIQKRDCCGEELFRLRKEIDTYRQIASKILSEAGFPKSSDDFLPERVGELGAILEESKGNRREKEAIHGQLESLEKDLSSEEEKRREVDASIQKLLAMAGVEDEASFQRLGKTEQRRLELLSAIALAQGNMRRVAGESDSLPFEKILSTLSLSDIRVGKESALREREGLDKELLRLQDERAEVKQTLKALSTGEEWTKLRGEEEKVLADMEENAAEWARYALAEYLIQEAREVFEKKHQPAILRDAGEAFKGMTGGKYEGVLSPLGENALFAVKASGERVSPEQLSRGAAEQLYLSVRFGFIRHQAQKAEPLPVVMDDILVNFDPDRAGRAAEAIRELSSVRQVLYFTCHPETVALFKALGGRIPVIHLGNEERPGIP